MGDAELWGEENPFGPPQQRRPPPQQEQPLPQQQHGWQFGGAPSPMPEQRQPAWQDAPFSEPPPQRAQSEWQASTGPSPMPTQGDPFGPSGSQRAAENPPDQPVYENVPKRNILSMLSGAGHPGGLLSILGALGGNTPQIQAAMAGNAMKQQEYQNKMEVYKQQAQSQYGRNIGGMNRTQPLYTEGGVNPEDNSSYGPGAWVPDSERQGGLRYIAGVRPPNYIANTNKQQPRMTSDQFMTQVLLEQEKYPPEIVSQAKKYIETKATHQEPSAQPVNMPEVPATETSPAQPASAGYFDPKARKFVRSDSPPVQKPGGGGMTSMNEQQAEIISDAIIAKKMPPPSNIEAARNPALKTALAKKGFDLREASLQYYAEQRYLASLNSTQQTRLRQAVSFAGDSATKIRGIIGELKSVIPETGFRSLNAATLAGAKQLPGRAGELAQVLETQIKDLTPELAQVYMGGNTPTDQALKLAASNLASNWNTQTLLASLDQIDKNLALRKLAFGSGGMAGTSYLPGQPGQPQAPTPAPGPAPTSAPTQPSNRKPISSFFPKR